MLSHWKEKNSSLKEKAGHLKKTCALPISLMVPSPNPSIQPTIQKQLIRRECTLLHRNERGSSKKLIYALPYKAKKIPVVVSPLSRHVTRRSKISFLDEHPILDEIALMETKSLNFNRSTYAIICVFNTKQLCTIENSYNHWMSGGSGSEWSWTVHPHSAFTDRSTIEKRHLLRAHLDYTPRVLCQLHLHKHNTKFQVANRPQTYPNTFCTFRILILYCTARKPRILQSKLSHVLFCLQKKWKYKHHWGKRLFVIQWANYSVRVLS